MWLALAMMFKCMEILGDTLDWKIIKAKDLPKHSRKKKKKKKKKRKKKRK